MLKDDIIIFENSKRDTDDYLELFGKVINHVSRQRDTTTDWSEFRKIVGQALFEVHLPDSVETVIASSTSVDGTKELLVCTNLITQDVTFSVCNVDNEIEVFHTLELATERYNETT